MHPQKLLGRASLLLVLSGLLFLCLEVRAGAEGHGPDFGQDPPRAYGPTLSALLRFFTD